MMDLVSVVIRKIQPKDNVAMAKIIRDSLTEFGANKPGTVYYDDSTDHLFELFSSPANSVYFIAENNDEVIGGAGIFPTEGLPEGTCELVKMYLRKDARGIGLGSTMIERCINTARELGYNKMYIESMPELKKALSVYEKFGFAYLNGPLGNSGHTGCDRWMLKVL
jgi:putative acetyltransferase